MSIHGCFTARSRIFYLLTLTTLSGCANDGSVNKVTEGTPAPTEVVSVSPTPVSDTPAVGSPPTTPAPTSTPDGGSEATPTPEPSGNDDPVVNATPTPTVSSPTPDPAGEDSDPSGTPDDAPTPTSEVVVTPTPDAAPTPVPNAETTPAPEVGATLTPVPEVSEPGSTDEPTPDVSVETNDDGDAVSREAGDCDDQDSARYPGNPEIAYDGIDQDCNGEDLIDVDGDGHWAMEVLDGDDCDDGNINSYPGASEFADGLDNDCDGISDNHLDSFDDDGDGAAEMQGDCNDKEPAIGPLAIEICNFLDDDCDGMADDADDWVSGQYTWYADKDRDGYADENAPLNTCASTIPDGYLEKPLDSSTADCNDELSSINPAGMEVCNAVDDDCDQLVDDADEGVSGQRTYFADLDRDGYGIPKTIVITCAPSAPAGYANDATDCEDSVSSIHPGAEEVCNSIDDDCDALFDDQDDSVVNQNSYFFDADADDFGDPSVRIRTCLAQPPTGYVYLSTDCDDSYGAVNPSAIELCNQIDDDCDGSVDDADSEVNGQNIYYADRDKDGFGDAAVVTKTCSTSIPDGYASSELDCDDQDYVIHPMSREICDQRDNNCDGMIDDTDPKVSGQNIYYYDADKDGFGDSSVVIRTCDIAIPEFYSSQDGDCSLEDSSVNPLSPEICNNLDDDCDSLVDDGDGTVVNQNHYFLDTDADGFGDPTVFILTCNSSMPFGYVMEATDCDDSIGAVNPSSEEVCNTIDDNCDGKIDDDDPYVVGQAVYYSDVDDDGFGDAVATLFSCLLEAPTDFVANDLDCDDLSQEVNPSAQEICNAIDDNCDQLVDDQDPSVAGTIAWYVDYDGDGFGRTGKSSWMCALTAPAGYSGLDTDCNDQDPAIYPGAEDLPDDGIDAACDGE